MSAMGGKLTLADWAKGRRRLALVGPMLKSGRQPTRFSRGKLQCDVVATSANDKLKAIGSGGANL